MSKEASRRNVLKALGSGLAIPSVLGRQKSQAQAESARDLESIDSQLEGGSWLSYGNGPQNDFHNPDTKIPVSDHNVEWTYNIPQVVAQPITDPQGETVYQVTDLTGELIAINIADGTEKFRTTIGDDSLDETPAWYKGNIAVPDNALKLIDPEQNGKVLDEFPTNVTGTHTPVIYNNEIATQTTENTAHILESSNNSWNEKASFQFEGNKEEKEGLTVDPQTGTLAAPHGSQVTFIDWEGREKIGTIQLESDRIHGLFNNGYYMVEGEFRVTKAFDPLTQEKAWEKKKGAPQVGTENLLINYDIDDDINSWIRALEPETGNEIWSDEVTNSVITDFFTGQDTLVIASDDSGEVFFYDLNSDSGEPIERGVGDPWIPKIAFDDKLLGYNADGDLELMTGTLRDIEKELEKDPVIQDSNMTLESLENGTRATLSLNYTDDDTGMNETAFLDIYSDTNIEDTQVPNQNNTATLETIIQDSGTINYTAGVTDETGNTTQIMGQIELPEQYTEFDLNQDGQYNQTEILQLLQNYAQEETSQEQTRTTIQQWTNQTNYTNYKPENPQTIQDSLEQKYNVTKLGIIDQNQDKNISQNEANQTRLFIQYNNNGNNKIELKELADAARDYAKDQLPIKQLSEIAQMYTQS